MPDMFILARALEGLALVTNLALSIYWWIVLIAVLISWVNPSPYNPIVQFLRRATEPAFGWVRRNVPGISRLAFSSGIDLSPIVVFLGIYFLQFFVPYVLTELAFRVRSL